MSESTWTARIAGGIAAGILLFAIFAAARIGLADIYATPAQSYLAGRSNAALDNEVALELTAEELNAISANLDRALAFTATNPELLSWAGRVNLYRLIPDELDAPEILEIGNAAAQRFNEALAARPTWPWDWLNLASARYEQFQDGSSEYHLALIRAMQFGAKEPTVHSAVAQLGLDTWPSLDQGAAQAVLQAVDSSLENNDPFLMELTEISEAWTEVCAALDDSYAHIAAVCKKHDLT